MKKCEQCGGTKRYMETSSVDSMFSELSYCRRCDENGMAEKEEAEEVSAD